MQIRKFMQIRKSIQNAKPMKIAKFMHVRNLCKLESFFCLIPTFFYAEFIAPISFCKRPTRLELCEYTHTDRHTDATTLYT
jgi:hypothetical protein